MTTQTHPCDTARLGPGETLHVPVDAGTAFLVTAGRVRLDEAPRWIADVCVPVGRTLDEGAHHVVERAGWITVTALGGGAQWRQWPGRMPAAARPLWRFFRLLAGA